MEERLKHLIDATDSMEEIIESKLSEPLSESETHYCHANSVLEDGSKCFATFHAIRILLYTCAIHNKMKSIIPGDTPFPPTMHKALFASEGSTGESVEDWQSEDILPPEGHLIWDTVPMSEASAVVKSYASNSNADAIVTVTMVAALIGASSVQEVDSKGYKHYFDNGLTESGLAVKVSKKGMEDTLFFAQLNDGEFKDLPVKLSGGSGGGFKELSNLFEPYIIPSVAEA